MSSNYQREQTGPGVSGDTGRTETWPDVDYPAERGARVGTEDPGYVADYDAEYASDDVAGAPASADPDRLKADIAQTRRDLSRNVDALGEAISPSAMAKRQASKVTDAVGDLKDRVMGSAEDAKDSTVGAVSQVGDRVGDVGHTAQRRTRGNPLAAGLIALGAGWLVSSMLPASQKEQELAEKARDQAAPLMQETQSVARESAENLREPAREAATSLRDKAQTAVENVKSESKTAGQDVRDSAMESQAALKAQHGS